LEVNKQALDNDFFSKKSLASSFGYFDFTAYSIKKAAF